MKKKILIISFLIFNFSCSYKSNSILLEEAEKFEQNKNYQKSLEYYFRIINTDKNKKRGLFAAEKAANIAQYELAQYLKTIMALDYILINSKDQNERLKVQEKKADIYFNNLLNYSKAIEEFNKLLLVKMNPENHIQTRFKIAKAFFFMNKFDQSLLEIDSILLTKNINLDLKFELLHFKGNTLLTVKKINKAIKIFKELLVLSPEKSKKENVKLSLVVCYEEIELFDEAISVLKTLYAEEEQRAFVELRIKKLKKRKKNLPRGKVR